MTIDKLIEKIGLDIQKKHYEEKAELNGSNAVLKHWYENMQNCEKIKDLNYYDNCINGMLYGLRAVYYITEAEHNQLQKELEEIFNKNTERIYQEPKQNSVLSKLNENKKALDVKDTTDRCKTANYG